MLKTDDSDRTKLVASQRYGKFPSEHTYEIERGPEVVSSSKALLGINKCYPRLQNTVFSSDTRTLGPFSSPRDEN